MMVVVDDGTRACPVESGKKRILVAVKKEAGCM